MNLRTDEIVARIESALRQSQYDECELVLQGGRTSLTRFADGEIHQNVEESRLLLRARVCRTTWSASPRVRMGSGATTDLTDNGIAAALDKAAELASFAPERDEYPGLAPPGAAAGGSSVAYTGHHDRATAETDAGFRANEVARAILPSLRMGYSAAGYYRIVEGGFGEYGNPQTIAVGNSIGVRQVYLPTTVDMMCSVSTPAGGTGWSVAWGVSRDNVDAEAVGRTAYEKARASERPVMLAPGDYRVLLEPAAVAELIRFVIPSFSLRAVREQRSIFHSRWGGRMGSDMVNLSADPHHLLLRLRPFDDEGLESLTLPLLEGGFHRELTVGWTEARALQRPSNGYSPLQPSAADAVPRGLVLAGGEGTVDDLQRRNPDCLRITRLWYNRFVNPLLTTVTGMTRDGFFEMRGADIYRALVNMRYNVNVFELLAQTVDMSSGVRMGDMVVPALVCDGFTLSSSTVST